MATALIEHTANREKGRFSFVRDGALGNYDVALKMIELVRSSVLLDKGLETFVKREVLGVGGFDSHSDTKDLFHFVYDYVKNNVDYIVDIAGRTESIKDARTTLQDGFGDCDDIAILIATILALCGFEPFFILARYANIDGYQHIYTGVEDKGERFIFDTIQDKGFNEEVTPFDTLEIGIFDHIPELDGTRGIVRGIKNLITDTGRNGLEALNLLSGMLPIGTIPAQALSIGTSLFKGVDTNESINALGSQTSGKLTDIIIQLQNGRLSIQIARQQARNIMSKFVAATLGSKADIAVIRAIEKRLMQRLAYIESFGDTPTTQGLTIPLDRSLMMWIGIAGISFGVLYFLKD